jgi:hypothetical protein
LINMSSQFDCCRGLACQLNPLKSQIYGGY